MADENKFYISAGLIPDDNSGGDRNKFYISAGLVPDDTAAGPSGLSIPVAYHHYQQMMRQ